MFHLGKDIYAGLACGFIKIANNSEYGVFILYINNLALAHILLNICFIIIYLLIVSVDLVNVSLNLAIISFNLDCKYLFI